MREWLDLLIDGLLWNVGGKSCLSQSELCGKRLSY